MKIQKILFVCKHNVFRSRVAEEYMKKKSSYEVSSAGLIEGDSLSKSQEIAALKFGINIPFKPRTLSIDLIKEQDIVIVTANDIPKQIFENPLYKLEGKIVFWKIKDVDNLFNPSEENSEKIVKKIIKKVDALIKKLDKKK